MRIRRKKHLDERLDNVSNYIIVANKDIINVNEAIQNKALIDYDKIFNNSNPVRLEIGCGKGGFIVKTASINSDVNFIAVELLQNVIVMACELVKNANLQNVKFINSGAEYLLRYIPENSIERIYLNFSPPYPKKSYSNRRLTNPRYLDSYKKMLVSGGEIYQKTDNFEFFEYSKECLRNNGFSVLDVSDDIDSGKIENVCTEYEKKFRDLGMKIYALIAKKID